MKSLCLCGIWLLMMMSSIVHASTWNKDIIEFATSLTLDHNSNIYNSTQAPVGSSVYQLTIVNNNVSLFEGYGVAIPFSIQRYSYADDSALDHTAYQINPALQIFWSQDTTLMFSSGVSKAQLFSGERGAEFVNESRQPLDKNKQYASASLQIGQAPQEKFFTLSVNYTANEIEQSNNSSERSFTENQSKHISSQYGYRISEDSYVQFSGNYAWQQTHQQSTRLAEAGFGFITGVGGSNELNVIVGAYQRFEQKQSGVFWTISDRWQASEQLILQFSTSQRSTLSNDATNISQLTTRYQLNTSYQLSDSHQFVLSLNQQRSDIKNHNNVNKSRSSAMAWQWRVASGFTIDTHVSYSKYDRSSVQMSRHHTQQNVGLSVGYQW